MAVELYSKGGVITRVANPDEKTQQIVDLFNNEIYGGQTQTDYVNQLIPQRGENTFIDLPRMRTKQRNGYVGVTVDKKDNLLGAVAIQPCALGGVPVVEVADIAVYREYRGRGYGDRMLHLAEKMTASLDGNARKIVVQPMNASGNNIQELMWNNAIIEKFYAKHGYRPDVQLTKAHPMAALLLGMGKFVLSKELSKK